MMKQISTRLLTVLGLCMFFLSACNNSSDFTVKGVVAGADGQLMYLENVGISNVVTLRFHQASSRREVQVYGKAS